MQVVVCLQKRLDRRRAQCADQLVLEVGVAHVDAVEGPPEHRFLAGIAQADDLNPVWPTQLSEEATDAVCTSEHHDPDAGRVEIELAAFGQRFERDLVADAFDYDEGARDIHPPEATVSAPVATSAKTNPPTAISTSPAEKTFASGTHSGAPQRSTSHGRCGACIRSL